MMHLEALKARNAKPAPQPDREASRQYATRTAIAASVARYNPSPRTRPNPQAFNDAHPYIGGVDTYASVARER